MTAAGRDGSWGARRWQGPGTAALSVRNFRLFYVGQVVSQTGNWMTLVAQTLLVLQLGGGGVALGALAAAQYGPVLCLTPWAGLVADRADRRRLMIWCQGASMAQSVALVMVAATGASLGWVYLVALVGGVTFAFENPVRRSFSPELVGEELLPSAVGLQNSVTSVGRAVGPLIAAVVVGRWGVAWAFALDALTYLATLVTIAMMDTTEFRVREPVERAPGQMRDGLAYVRANPELRTVLVQLGVLGVLAYNFATVVPLLATKDLSVGDTAYAVLVTVSAVGSFLGAVLAARGARSCPSVSGWWALALGVSLGALAVSPTWGVAVVASAVAGVASGGFLTSSLSAVQIGLDPAMRGRMVALQAVVFIGATAIGGPLSGAVSQEFGARWGLALGCGGAVVCGAWTLWWARRYGDRHLDQVRK